MKVILDDRIRLVSSAFLMTRYRDYTPQWKPHELKRDMLRRLEGFADHPCAKASRELVEEGYFFWAFYQHTVCPQRYASMLAEFAGIDYDDFQQHDYESLLQDFARDTEIASMWNDQSELWEEVRSDCESYLTSYGVAELLRSLFGPPPVDLVVVPIPLVPSSHNFCVFDQTTWSALLGPPAVLLKDEKPVSYFDDSPMLRNLCLHEFCHPFWQEAKKHCLSLPELIEPLQERIVPKEKFTHTYPFLAIQFEEIVVRASVALCVSFAEGEQAGRVVIAEEKEKHNIDLVESVYTWLKKRHCEHGQLPPKLLGRVLPDMIAYISNS